MMPDEIKDEIAEVNEEALFADNFDEALIGYVEQAGGLVLAVYDRDLCIQVLMKDMTHEEAVEYFDFNVAGAYMGPHTPCFLTNLKDAE